jgi:hypothetical protein
VGYFLSDAAQFTTTVNGAGRPALGVVTNRKRLSSGMLSHPTGIMGGGALNNRLGVPAWNPLLVSISTAIKSRLVPLM